LAQALGWHVNVAPTWLAYPGTLFADLGYLRQVVAKLGEGGDEGAVGLAVPDLGQHAQQVHALADLSVRGYLRHLRWITPVLLVGCLGMWALGARGMSLPWALFLWVLLTVAVGPLVWLRVGVRSGTPRWWRALGVAVPCWLGMFALLGIGYALVMAVLSGS
jgi:hypothetical protein